MPHFKLAPSILASDFARLGEQVREAEAAGADWIHVDVMDGQFVPNITLGPPIIASLRPVTTLPFDTHLMIANPDRYLDLFAEAGCNRLTVHIETCPHLNRTITAIKELGMQAGVTLNPATPLNTLEEILPIVDLVLIMSVNPGFGGQSYIPTSTDKIRRLRAMLDAIGSPAELEVDGGVHAANIREVVTAGASVIVAGSAVFGGKASVAENVRLLRAAAES